MSITEQFGKFWQVGIGTEVLGQISITKSEGLGKEILVCSTLRKYWYLSEH